jgi:hypothetical protein
MQDVTLTAHEAAVAAAALDYMAHFSELEDREPVLREHTADYSAAPLTRLATQIRARSDASRDAIAGR